MNMIGARFGRLTVIAPAPSRASYRMWECECDCGSKKVVRGSHMTGGKTKSCGCLVRTRSGGPITKHGYADSPTWQSWKHMLARCKDDHRYRDRGITFFGPWLDFLNFLADMGERPPGTSLDRINNDGNYEPGNCRWATQREQMRNTRRNRRITFGGETLTITDWGARVGIDSRLIYARIKRLGWTIERALTTPPATMRRRS